MPPDEMLERINSYGARLVTHFREELWGLSNLRPLEVVTTTELQASGFIEGLADGTPKMECLHLTVVPYTQSRNWKGLWDALRRLRKLTKLHIWLPKIDELDAGDARSMREAWPALSYLYILRSTQLGDHTEGLSLDFLNAITHHFSKSLTTLGLCFGPNKPSSTYPIDPVRFEKLQLLHIQSFSTVEDPEELVNYFAQILPREATFKADPRNGWDKVADSLERARVCPDRDQVLPTTIRDINYLEILTAATAISY
ncbi:hypothetical protein FS837_011946 [Tulasnella sp. UAMH 9824]|nr:hypothetical protein FS837_011946 [Tulasnella sp. UAMH 9824]